MIFRQKKGLVSREFELTNKEIKVKTSNFTENNEYIIKLENLGNQITYHKEKKTLKKISIIIFSLIKLFVVIIYFIGDEPPTESNLIVILGSLTLLSLIMGFSKLKNDTHIIGGTETLTFFQNIPSKNEVDNFINIIIKKARENIREKYFKVDIDLSEETQMSTYYWLFNNDFISEIEYNDIKKEYKTNKLL